MMRMTKVGMVVLALVSSAFGAGMAGGTEATTEAAGPLTGVVDVAVGNAHSCALLSDGTAKCWGENEEGALGVGGGDRLNPATVKTGLGGGPLTGITAIVAGDVHSCALLADATARCWGLNGSGQLGDGTKTWQDFPVVVKNSVGNGPLTGISSLTADSTHTCAVLVDETARCWGNNFYGVLGNGDTGDLPADQPLPVVVKNAAGTGPLTGIAKITGGNRSACALLAAGTVRCWGVGGQLGDGTQTERRLPVVVKNPAGTGPLTSVADIAVGQNHACAVMSDSTARCWGSNGSGYLGDGTTTTRLRPVVVKNPTGAGPLTGVTNLDAQVHTCAARGTAPAVCWGSGADSKLGNGTTGNRLLPTPVKGTGGSGQLTGVSNVAVNYGHSCARMADGSARCWGKNDSGQLGNGTRVLQPVPVIVKRGS